MTLSLLFLCPWRKALWVVALSLGLYAASTGFAVWGEGTNSAPEHPGETPADSTNFSQYLVDHQADLGPFFEQHRDAIFKEAIPVVVSLIGSLLLLNLAIGFFFDVGLGFGYSFFFAPLYAKIKRALIYASGRLALSLVVAVLTGLLVLAVSAINPLLGGLMLLLMLVLNLVVQIVWVTMMYRTPLLMSVLFYVALILAHAVLGSLVTFPIGKARISNAITQFMDQNVTSQLKLAVADAKRDLTAAQDARTKARSNVTEAKESLDQANAEQVHLKQEIEQKRDSEAFVYGQVVRLHAQGNLNGARAGLTDFLTKFPNGTLKNAAQGQLTQVESEIAAQEAQRKQAEADAAAAAAAARADLLARAAKAQVTLSEMRQALIGKSTEDVTGLFGKPTETGTDRWGYGQKMIVNILTEQTYGLAVYFSEGKVQSVDYYYGTGAAK